MSHRKKVDYYEAFCEMMEYTCEAAKLLNQIFNDFNYGEIDEKRDEMHSIEHSADIQRRLLMNKLAREFITPMDREDIMAMADGIDNITDYIEDVLLRVYMYNIKTIREDGKKFSLIVVKCCESLQQLLKEFHNYRKSEKIVDLMAEVNRLEEVADQMFTESTHRLYLECKDPIEVMSWDQTLHYLENCCDACEDVSNIVESVMMKAN